MFAVAIVGPGAIGTAIAAALQESGQSPILCGRRAQEHLELQRAGEVVRVPGPIHTDPAEIDQPVDLIFLAVKATQLEAAAPWLRVLTGPGTVVCVLQNGIEQIDSVEPLARGGSVVPSVVWFPAERQPGGVVRLRGEARLTLPESEPARRIRDVLAKSWCEVDLTEDFTTAAWQKLLQNAAAGLMVLTGRRSGMYGREDISALTLGYLRESLAVARAEGAQLDDDLPDQVLDNFRSSPPDRGTSILADRVAGQPLEWRTRNEIISRRARRHEVATPLGDALVALLAAASDGPG